MRSALLVFILFVVMSCSHTPEQPVPSIGKGQLQNEVTSKSSVTTFIPSKAKLYKQLKFAQKLMGDEKWDESKKILLNCIEQNPYFGPCHWEIGWVYQYEGNWDKVFSHWNISDYFIKSDKLRKQYQKFFVEAKNLKAIYDLGTLEDHSFSLTKFLVEKNIEQSKEGIRILAAGDIMLGTLYPEEDLPSHDGKDYFTAYQDLKIQSDVRLFNLEGPLCDEGGPSKQCDDPKHCYLFRSPERYAKTLAEMFNVASLANNHIMDFGLKCYKSTVSSLKKSKIIPSNGYGENAIFSVKGKKVGVISFYTHNEYLHNILDVKKAQKRVLALKKVVDIVIVSFHGGAEGHSALRVPKDKMEIFYSSPRGELRKFTHAVIDAGADLVVGHGPHVVRGVELYKDRLIAYSLGNLMTYGNFNLLGYKQMGAFLKVQLGKKGEFLNAKVISTRQKGEQLVRDQEQNSYRLIRTLSRLDFPTANLLFTKEGEIYRTVIPEVQKKKEKSL